MEECTQGKSKGDWAIEEGKLGGGVHSELTLPIVEKDQRKRCTNSKGGYEKKRSQKGVLEINSKYQRREYDTKIRTHRATWNLVAPAGTRDGQTSSSAKIITDSY